MEGWDELNPQKQILSTALPPSFNYPEISLTAAQSTGRLVLAACCNFVEAD
jgi:hypothetical protein